MIGSELSYGLKEDLKDELRRLQTVKSRSKLHLVIKILEQIDKENKGLRGIEQSELSSLLKERLQTILRENTPNVVERILRFLDKEKSTGLIFARDSVDLSHEDNLGFVFISNVPSRCLSWIEIMNEFKIYGKIIKFWVNVRERWIILRFKKDVVVERCVSVEKAFFGNRFVKVSRYEGSVRDLEMRVVMEDYMMDDVRVKLRDLKSELKVKEENLLWYRATLEELRLQMLNTTSQENASLWMKKRFNEIKNDMERECNTTDNLIMLRLYIMELESEIRS